MHETNEKNAEVFRQIKIATRGFADKVKEEVLSKNLSTREIDIWTEGDFGTLHKQLGFTVWYSTREEREAAILDGETKSIEESIRECCINHGFPREEQDRIYVWFDSYQALARLINQEVTYSQWKNKKTLQMILNNT